MVRIITLNFNQHEYSSACVKSILKSEGCNFHIYLIDNGSTLKNYNRLKDLIPDDDRLSVTRIEQNRGYVGGINFGLDLIDNLNSDFVMILNNDTIIDKYAIKCLIDTCESFNRKAIVSGKVFHYDEPDRLQDVGYSYKSKKNLKFNRIGLNELDVGQYDTIEERDMLDDVFWLLPWKLIKEIGGYCEYFWFNAEQADFALRAKKLGYKLVFSPDAKIWHKGSVSVGGRDRNPRLAFWHIQSTLIFRYRHLSRMRFLLQYFRIWAEIIGGYAKTLLGKLRGSDESFDYVHAKLLGLNYFNKWFFKRNANNGYQPY